MNTAAQQYWYRGLVIAGLLCAVAFLPACGSEDPDPSASGNTEQGAAASPVAHSHGASGTCFICDPTKREAGRLWCTEHSRYEDRCWKCQPQLEDASRPYCVEHSLYEDECHLCNPSLQSDAAVPSDRAGSAAPPALFCKEHNVPEAECGICQPQLAGALATGESLSIRMPSVRSADLAGLTIERPSRGDATATLQLLGEFRYNENKRAKITPLASGVLTDISVDVGESVEAGQILAVVNSVVVAQAKSAYLSALAELDVRAATYEREQRLAEENIAARRDLQEAEGAHRLAVLAVHQTRQQLFNLAFSKDDVAEIEEKQSATSDLFVRAPFAGTVVERSAVLGEAVDSDAIFEIADLSTMWIELAVPEDQVVHLVRGGAVVARVKALPRLRTEGKITWISPQIDERTRMVRARATVPNAEGVLRHGMFTEVSALLGNPHESLQLPSESVHEIGGATYVFVRDQPDLFDLRRVEIGPRSASGEASVLAGLNDEDDVVTGGSFTMRTEFLKSRLGAGCVDD